MNDFALPVTRYALSGDVSIAFQVMGEGPAGICSRRACRFASRRKVPENKASKDDKQRNFHRPP
jgi:hypothetical protein